MFGGLHHHGMRLRQIEIFTAEVLHHETQHPQINVDCGGLGSLVVNFHRHHVALVPRKHSCRDSVSTGGHQAVINREMLAKSAARKHVLAGVHEIDVNVAAAAAIITAGARKTGGGTVLGENIHAIDLK